MSECNTNTGLIVAKPRPQSLNQAKDLGVILAQSKFFADAKEGAQACVKVLAGSELGFGPIASMTGVYIVKGRVSLSANMMASAIQNSGRFRFRVKEHSKTACRISFQEWDEKAGEWEDVGESSFDMDDAKLAGLSGSDTYKKFPRNMLYARAMSNGAKWYCPSVFGGHTPYLPDEIHGTGARMKDDGEYEVPVSGMVSEAVVIEENPVPASVESLAKCEQLIELTKTELCKFCANFGISEVKQLSEKQAIEALNILEMKAEVMGITLPEPTDKTLEVEEITATILDQGAIGVEFPPMESVVTKKTRAKKKEEAIAPIAG